MENNLTFSEYSETIINRFDQKDLKNGLISLCLQLPHFDLLEIYDYFFNPYSFSYLWHEKNNVSFIALDKCRFEKLIGSNKFIKAKDFNNRTFQDLINLDKHYHDAALPKIIYLFSFSDNSNDNNVFNQIPNMEAVLPKILLIKSEQNYWIRMNTEIENKSGLIKKLYDFWSFREKVINYKSKTILNKFNKIEMNSFYERFDLYQQNLKENISRAIKLTEEGKLEKIIISARLIFKIKEKFNLKIILEKLKDSHPNSCLYVWKRNNEDITFGASPEKLFSYHKKILILEAIAGTSKTDLNAILLLENEKNIREHSVVINYLLQSLDILEIRNFKKENLKIISFGEITHLYTKIVSEVERLCPFKVLELLHPSPAVCGYPKKEALNYIEIIESFKRGNYASPIGWVDTDYNTDFRVAIRGARYKNSQIEFTAGSGIVRGSVCEEEIEEIKLKFESLVKQVFV